MGVDFLDITFKLERRFGVKIPMREWANVVTVADLVAIVLRVAPLRGARQDRKVLLIDVGDVVAEAAALVPGSVGEETSLDAMDLAQRAAVWRALRNRYYWLPSGDMERWQEAIAHTWRAPLILGVVAGAIFLAAGPDTVAVWGRMTLACAAGFAAAIVFVLCRSSTRVGLVPPATIRTVGDVLDVLSKREEQTATEGMAVQWQEEVITAVREILVDALAVKPETVTLRAELVRDLGAS